MNNRLEFHKLLCDILGSKNVYFQPPASVMMRYPAIKYSLDNIENNHANDDVYIQSTAYQLIVIDKDPESVIAQKISKLPKCRFATCYPAENLYHYVFTIYY